jgi:hypothetical protein
MGWYTGIERGLEGTDCALSDQHTTSPDTRAIILRFHSPGHLFIPLLFTLDLIEFQQKGSARPTEILSMMTVLL